jgi:hypothetical protein
MGDLDTDGRIWKYGVMVRGGKKWLRMGLGDAL